jgi:hypothetical protein
MIGHLRLCALAAVLFGLVLAAPVPRAVAGEPPVAGWEPTGDVSMLSGGNASFIVNCTPGCSTLAFQWFIDGALVPGEKGPAFTYSAGTNLSGTLRVSVVVTDWNSSARNAWNVTVEQPLRSLPEGPVSMEEGTTRTFRVLGAAGRNVSWFMDGADAGTNDTELVYSPDFRSAGIHQVAVSVEGANVHTWPVSVTDVNRPPVLAPGRLVRAYAGDAVSVRPNGTDPDGGPLRYRWDLDSDGTAESDSNLSGNLSRRFARPGVYRATLTVTDGGGASASAEYVFDIWDRPASSVWAIPAALAGLAALFLVAVVAVQGRRLSRLKEARWRAGFFTGRERPALAPKAGPYPAGPAPEAAPGKEDEPELLRVRSLLPAKRAELEASPGQQASDISLSKKLKPPGPPGVPPPEPERSAGAQSGVLNDKGAESESRALETEVGRRPEPKKK